MVKKLLERFTKRNCKNKNQKEFTVGKILKKKGHKLYVNWKDYDSSFNSWIDKKNVMQIGGYFPRTKSLGAKVKIKLN